MFCSVVKRGSLNPASVTRSRCALILKYPCSLAVNVLHFKTNNQADVFKNLKKTFKL